MFLSTTVYIVSEKVVFFLLFFARKLFVDSIVLIWFDYAIVPLKSLCIVILSIFKHGKLNLCKQSSWDLGFSSLSDYCILTNSYRL